MMEVNSLSQQQTIVEDYYKRIKLLQEKEISWWNVASEWHDGEYGASINRSLEIATDIVRDQSREDYTMEGKYLEFSDSLKYILKIANAVDKNTLMVGKIISSAQENNSALIEIAQMTLQWMKKFQKDSITNFLENQDDESVKSSYHSILKKGSRGKEVETIQVILNKLSYYISAIDGVYGPKMASAVSKFQKDNGLSVTGEVDEITLKSIQSVSQKLNDSSPGYWFLKLNPATWVIPNLMVGREAWFHTHDLQAKKRTEYELFLQIRKGDKIIGYAFGNYNSVICLFEVKEGVHNNPSLGEVIALTITQVFERPKSVSEFSDKITFVSELGGQSPLRLFSVTKEMYMSIIEAGPAISKKVLSQFLPFFSPEGDHVHTDDKLDFENDIDAIATVISLKDVVPPLAIGLFGYWGSGKSFFIEKLYEKIKVYAKSANSGFIENVVQVKFNSWHYSDTNLWASIITKIFDSLVEYSKEEGGEAELKKLTNTLEFTSLQKKIVEDKRRELEENVNRLKEEQKRKRDRLEDLSGVALVKLILSDKKIENSFSELKSPDIENIIKDTNKLDDYVVEVKNWKNRLMYYLREFANLKGWRWIVVIIIPLVFAGLFAINKYFPGSLKNIAHWISWESAIITAAIGKLVQTAGAAISSSFKVLDRLDSVRKTIQARSIPKPQELTENEKALLEVNTSLVEINEKIRNTQNEIADIISGRELLKFIEQRSRDEKYANQLGLISWIYKDFYTLDELLRKQHILSDTVKAEVFNPQDVKLRIDRIILYIDDLDRCKEEVVVKVLEAIHLLLAFPLFVVVVGVDPRWLNNAITEKYRNLFGGGQNSDKENKNKEPDFSNAATSYDYLEKIFQIPFMIKPINKGSRENLIQYLLRNEMESEASKTNTEKNDTKQVNINSISPEDQTSDNSRDTVKPEIQDSRTVTEKIRLTFTQKELDFMQEISSLYGHTPRIINRYVNIYRIIKSHRSLAINGGFSEDEFMPIMTILGIIVGYPIYAQGFIEDLSAADKVTQFSEFIGKSKIPDILRKNIENIIIDKNLESMPLEPFKRNLELISRFSFRTLQYRVDADR